MNINTEEFSKSGFESEQEGNCIMHKLLLFFQTPLSHSNCSVVGGGVLITN